MTFRVALIYPYFRTRSANELLFPPLGVAALAGQLHARGIEARVFDCTFDTFENVQTKLETYHADIAGVYSMVTLSRSTFRLADMLREILPECLRVAGGPLPSLYPDQYSRRFDLVFRGEADLSFPRFCQDYRDHGLTPRRLGELPLDSYAGLHIHQNGFRAENPLVHFDEQELSAFPLPYRGDFDHAAYQEVWRQRDGTRTTSLMTTLGCPFTCDFCSRPIFGERFRRRNLDQVFAEIDQIKNLGYDALWIADDNFTLDAAFLKEFCRRMRNGNMTWSCLSRVTGIDAKIAATMKAGGCRKVYLGLESGNPLTLELMRKQATLEDGRAAVRTFHEAGIETAAFFIVGYPGETTAAVEDTFRFALDLPLDEISFNVPYPLPGSRLFKRIGKVDQEKDWTVENETTFVYTSEFDPVWLRRRIEQTLQDFAHKKPGA